MLELQTERLILRAPVPEDAEALAPMYADPEVMRYVGDGRTLTRADTELSVRRMIERWNEDGFGLYTTLRQDDGVVIGRVGILIWNSVTWEPTTRAQASGPTEVEVGALLAIDLDVDERVVHGARDVGIVERLVRHHEAPVTRGVADREQDRLVLLTCTRERLFSPRVPVDGVVGVLQEIRARLVRQAIHARLG